MDNICEAFQKINLKFPMLYPMLLDDLRNLQEQYKLGNEFYSLEYHPFYDMSEINIIELLEFIHDNSNCKIISSDIDIEFNNTKKLLGIYIDLFLHANSFV